MRPQTWDFSIWVAGATGEESTNSLGESQIFTAGVYVGRVLTGELGSGWWPGHIEYGLGFTPVFLQYAPSRISGTAFDPVILRWNSSLRFRRAAPFLELGGGAVHTNTNFPAGDTSSFNFMARGGGGIQIASGKRQSLEIACRWWHISNANLGVRNPEFNGVQVSIGWHWLK